MGWWNSLWTIHVNSPATQFGFCCLVEWCRGSYRLCWVLKDLIPASTNQFKGRGSSFYFRFACVVAWEKQPIIINICWPACQGIGGCLLWLYLSARTYLFVVRRIYRTTKYIWRFWRKGINIQFLTPVSRVPSEAKKETQQVQQILPNMDTTITQNGGLQQQVSTWQWVIRLYLSCILWHLLLYHRRVWLVGFKNSLIFRDRFEAISVPNVSGCSYSVGLMVTIPSPGLGIIGEIPFLGLFWILGDGSNVSHWNTIGTDEFPGNLPISPFEAWTIWVSGFPVGYGRGH